MIELLPATFPTRLNTSSFVFNGTKVQLAASQKYLGFVLDSKLDFNEHVDRKINKCNKIISIMKIHF